ncbi:MAG: dephospho-CoA kinase, partial [Acidimicrobiia bacterium]
MTSEQRHWILCGGLASGKSQVRRLLEHHGFETIDADEFGHRVLRSDGAAFAEVVARWPDVVVDGEIDRGLLASEVFSDTGQLRELESITHPHIFDAIRTRVEQISGLVYPSPDGVEDM